MEGQGLAAASAQRKAIALSCYDTSRKGSLRILEKDSGITLNGTKSRSELEDQPKTGVDAPANSRRELANTFRERAPVDRHNL